MATTYTLISSVTVGSGGAANIEFTSIPSTYTDLKLVISHRTNRAVVLDGFYLSINNQPLTSTGESRYVLGDGSSASSGAPAGQLQIGASTGANATANTFASSEVYITNYANTSTNKSMSFDNVTEDNSSNGWNWLGAGLYNINTNAITSLKVLSGTGSVNLVQYSTAYLYGISNA
jgi:hypothetical protein